MPRCPLPRIAESAPALLEMRRRERDEQRRERLHLLWLLASSTVADRQSAAWHLGHNRQTVGLWLKRVCAKRTSGLLACAPVTKSRQSGRHRLARADQSRHPRPAGRVPRGTRLPGPLALGPGRARADLQLPALPPLGPRSAWSHPQGGTQKPRTKKEAQLTAFRDAGLKEA